MGAETQDSVRERAIEWHVRLRHGDDATWEAFAEWLAEDPRHAEAYDEIERTDLAIEPLLPGVVFREAANDVDVPIAPPGRRARRWVVVGGALAASVAAAVVLVPQLASGRYDVATGPGERRTVTLGPATRIVLNGSTRMTFDRKDPRFAALTEGEALFRVRHDGAKPFRLELGEDRVEDAGTIFNVARGMGEVRVAVAEGKVVYNPGRDAVPLDAGQALVDRSGSKIVRVTRIPVEAVGSWEKGRLVYSGAPMSEVAADLGRALGVRIAVSPAIADRPFSGAIALDGSRAEQRKRLELALNVVLEAGPHGWTMKPADGAVR
ncbi:FecR family protein [Sphingomonas sp. DT-204]|uniref:FecR family protein n=1 Tax=Sphingomonas sp. DT-204 TaxID=3396166 RepID=UPI003F540E71